VKKLLITLFLTLGLNAHASTPKIESVILNDGTVIKGSEIASVRIFSYINTVDYIALKEGSRIESSDIKKVIFKDSGSTSKTGLENQVNGVRSGGDGSGG
jgi:hypothetical protein